MYRHGGHLGWWHSQGKKVQNGRVDSYSFPLRIDLTAPRVPVDAVQRSRLTDLLHTLPPLTVIRAPGGSGKTVLGTQLVTGRNLLGAWVTVDNESSTRDGFWRLLLPRLLGAGRSAMYLASTEPPSRRSLIDAFQLVGDAIVVIDDAHLIEAAAEVAADIVDCLRSTSVRFVILTRTPVGALEDASTRLAVDVVRVGIDELTFTVDEVQRLSGLSSPAEELLAASGGNALLLRALVLDADPAENAPRLPIAPTALAFELISGYVAELDFEMRHFLLRTALGADFTVGEAELLVGPGDHSSTVAEVERRGFLMRYRSRTEDVFRYHPVVREVLSSALAEKYPEEIPRLHRIIARARAAEGKLVDAYRHALNARDYRLATDILIRGGTVILRSGGGEVSLTIPLRVALSHPLLAMARGLAENARERHWVAREFFAAAMVAGRAKTHRSLPERATLAVSESVISRISGRPQDGARTARTALDLIDRAGPEAFGPQVNELYAACAVSFFQAGAWEEAIRVLERVPITSARGGLTSASVQAAIAAIRGDWPLVESFPQRVAEAGWPESAVDTYAGALLHFAVLLRDLARGRTGDIRERLELWASQETLEFRVHLLSLGHIADVVEGVPERAIRSIVALRDQEESRGRLSDANSRLLALTECVARIASGDLVGAERLLKRPAGAWGSILRAQMALLQRDEAKAARALADPLLTNSTDGHVLAARHLLQSWRSVVLGDVASAGRILRLMSTPGEISAVTDIARLLPDDVREELLASLPSTESRLRSSLVVRGDSPFREQIAHQTLTPRELAVVLALRAGESNEEIAKSLNISPNTLKTQLRAAYRKLGVTNRRDAIARVGAFGLGEGP